MSEDGHCAEGGDYFDYSFTTSIQLWHVYSRFMNRSLQDIVPERFKKAGKYIEAIMSTTSKKGKRIAINCGGGKEFSTLLMIFMTMVCNFDAGNYYLTERLQEINQDESTTSFDILFYEFYKNQIQLKPEAKILYAKKSEKGYQFRADTGMLYGDNIIGIRKGELDTEKSRLEIMDEWTFPEEHPLMITYISLINHGK
ncbi:MAG TPA: hypothetical protein DEG06_09930 [Lachnospiraceae bacterium]|nr:hypothetical protein [Lachnospiraceae bacterium]HBY72544.1 hypothetical protein [Lachnospiraceae bacterium]HCM13520.1 hypothetical protein [Lachnospiraceae bacterium]HCR41248.1 hypothetical protein [Lachnospiraceae bacterium]